MRIIRYPHPTLRHESKPLQRVDAKLRKMIAEMLELMYSDRGIGLAANQVDLPYRFFVMNIKADSTEKEEEHVFLNPVISKRSGSAEAEEGCLSLPEIYAPVRRPEKIVLSAYGLDGREITYKLDGLYARAVQHEVDHLDGVLFVDHLTPAHRLAVKQDLEDLEQAFHGDRQRGVIPDDGQIAARLAELETLRT